MEEEEIADSAKAESCLIEFIVVRAQALLYSRRYHWGIELKESRICSPLAASSETLEFASGADQRQEDKKRTSQKLD